MPLDGRVVELPVVYGGDGGPHMADVVAHTGLSVEEIVSIHSAPVYPVYALGSHPGYCYLGGMDPRIATPRRKVPVIRIPGGAVSIGGAQTGVSASDGPSGWNTIGTTEMIFFDATRDPPALLQPGDSIASAWRRSANDRDPLAERLRQRPGPRPLLGGCAGASAPPAPWTGSPSPAATSCSATPTSAAGIEVQVFPFEVRFEADHGFALTGADCAATLDGVPLLPWSSAPSDGGTGPAARASPGGALARRAGPTSRLPAASTCRWCSARAAPSCAARSAGIEGRMLRQGDRLRGRRAGGRVGDRRPWCRPASRCRSRPTACPRCACCPAAEYDCLHRGLARPLLGGAVEDHAAERPLRLPPRRAGPRAEGPAGDALARHRARA